MLRERNSRAGGGGQKLDLLVAGVVPRKNCEKILDLGRGL
jgi:hypothetical protein